MGDLEIIQIEAIRQIQSEMKEIYGVWNEIGLSPVQQQERVKTAWDHIHTLVQDIKNEEISLCVELKDNIRSLTEKVSNLSLALSVETSQVAGLTYLQRLEALHQEYNRLSDLKERRMKELKELRTIELKYCGFLGAEVYNLSSTTEVPSEADLKELCQHISMLADEQAKRYKEYCLLKQQFSSILEVTGTAPETSLEKHICSEKEPTSLSKSTFQQIEEIIAQARKRKAELENKKNILMDRLTHLWDRLSVQGSFRIDFITEHLDCKASTLAAIECEVEKYEDMKKKNLDLCIDSVRKELSELWHKCGASDLEKQLFDPYYSKDSTEGILTIHEDEVERWKKYFEEVRYILEKIDKRNKLWELLKVLDNKANDPERFKNRGGNLLKEEKERNRLLKTLPSLEQEIRETIEKYEAETRKKFLYLGEDYQTVICDQWEGCANSKENVKQEKKCTPAKRTPFTTPKRSPYPKYVIYRPGTTPRRTIKKRELDVLKEVGGNLNNEQPTCSNATSYPDFEAELNRTGRKSLRSSVVASKKIGGTRTPQPHKKRLTLGRNEQV